MSLGTLKPSVLIRDVDAMPAHDSYPIGRRIVRLEGDAIRTRSDIGRLLRHRRNGDTSIPITPMAIRAGASPSASMPSPRGAFPSG